VILLLTGFWLIWWNGQGLQVSDARIGRRVFTAMSMVAALVAVLVPPLFTVNAITGAREARTLPTLFLGSWRSTTLVLTRLALPAARASGLILASFVAVSSVKLVLGGVSASEILTSQLLLLLLSLVMVSAGFCCSTLFRDVHVAAGLLYLVVLLAVGAPVLTAPLIARLANAELLIGAELLVNPLIATASAIGLDLMRTELIYDLSPIGQRRFAYPSWLEVAAFYLLLSALLFCASVWRVQRMRREIT
jgi:hypothetical protein